MNTSAIGDIQTNHTKLFYLSVWRWHFYAGLYAVPFLLMLSITGLLMMYSPVIERFIHQDLYTVEHTSLVSMSFEEQRKLVVDAYPNDKVKNLYSPASAEESTRFQVVKNEEAFTVFVDPYQGEVLGEISISNSLYSWADNMHGTFMLGLTGDRMIEIAASFTILLVLTGLFLWWPRSGKTLRESLRIGKNKGRIFWRDLHSVVGVWTSILLVFFCLSGLAWASVWGGSMMQAWSTFPMDKSASSVSSTLTHEDLNVKGLKQVPWGLEQSALPESVESLSTHLDLDQIVAVSKTMGFTQFQVHFPNDEMGVYTTSASSMSKDIENATDDRTVHFDQYTGKVLADVDYGDYSLAAKAMAVGISLHMAQWGIWNYILNTLFCLAVITICVSGVVMWWVRRPSEKFQLSAPKKPKNLLIWKQATWFILPISLLFPLAAMTMVCVLILDRVILLLSPKVRVLFD